MPTITVAEFQELSKTPGVNQETDLGQDKGKGPELPLESMTELQKCDSCEKGVECIRPQMSSP